MMRKLSVVKIDNGKILSMPPFRIIPIIYKFVYEWDEINKPNPDPMGLKR